VSIQAAKLINCPSPVLTRGEFYGVPFLAHFAFSLSQVEVRIIIAGDGEVGLYLAQELSKEDHHITMIVPTEDLLISGLFTVLMLTSASFWKR
jgi:hypothetical protein